MNLDSLDLLSLQTLSMQKDETTQGFCAALNPQFIGVATQVEAVQIYSRIDSLPEDVLDILAWQFHVDWYDSEASIDIKRKNVKSALLIQKTRGTPYAVELLIEELFGDGEVLEWFQYGGDPFHFKVLTANNSVTSTNLQKFLKAIDFVKNKRSRFDGVEITAADELNIYFGNVIHIADFMTIRQVV